MGTCPWKKEDVHLNTFVQEHTPSSLGLDHPILIKISDIFFIFSNSGWVEDISSFYKSSEIQSRNALFVA